MRIEALRKQAGQEEIDYQFIKSALSEYAYPRDKITAWLKSGELIRVKKGLYIFGEGVSQRPYSKETLANLIYGPSAISLTYALSYYGLIPERVETVTSITNSRNKIFSTGVGAFQYCYLHPKKYAAGILLRSDDQCPSFLIASPEKALCDQLHLIDSDYVLKNLDDMDKYLLLSLRIDESLLVEFDLIRLKELSDIYHNPQLTLLYDYIKARK
jgi:hypothetical protein